MERGANQAEVAKQLGMKPFPAKKLCEQARAFSEAELADAVVRLARLDEAVKGGSRLDPRLELELALAEISGPNERARQPPRRSRRWSRWPAPRWSRIAR